jgi:alpha-L-fucosidase
MKRRTLNRRQFIQWSGTLVSAAYSMPRSWASVGTEPAVPSYLRAYEDTYRTDPHQAALEWFRHAKFGLFIHYGPNALVSMMGSRVAQNDWLQYREKLSVAEYAKIAQPFIANRFDSDFITDLVLEADMRYLNITTRHHDGFCLFDSRYTNFKSTNTPAQRDLVAELTEQCRKKGLGIFYYYSHGRDWRHPHAPNNDEWGGSARPPYAKPEPQYQYGDEHDLNQYVDFMKSQITELLTNYGRVGGIWLDGIAVPKSRPERAHLFRCQELYDHIHRLQPQALVSYKQGLTGTEDFLAPERGWKEKSNKPLEICDTLQPRSWFYNKTLDGKHKSADDVMAMLKKAQQIGANLLLNTGPLPDGSIHPEDVKTLKEVGRRLRTEY